MLRCGYIKGQVRKELFYWFLRKIIKERRIYKYNLWAEIELNEPKATLFKDLKL